MKYTLIITCKVEDYFKNDYFEGYVSFEIDNKKTLQKYLNMIVQHDYEFAVLMED